MTISTQETKISYNGNGVTTEFAFPYRFLSSSHLVVSLAEVDDSLTTLVLNTDYTVTGVGDDSGGTIAVNVAPSSVQRLIIYRRVPLTQETDYVSGDSFPAETHEEALDKLTMIVQQHAEELSRAVQVNIASDVLPEDYITAAENAATASAVSAAESAASAAASAASAVEAATFDPALFLSKADNLAGVADPATALANLGGQPFDADTAKTDVSQNFTSPQRSALLVDNDGSFDLSAKQNFKCTTAGAVTLTFTNQADGLSGAVIFINASNHVISAHANTKISAASLARLSATGTYRIDYMSDGTNAFCTVSENLA